jgi:uncharacterized membrane protein YhhN
MNFWTAAFLFILIAEIIFLPCYLFAPFCKGVKRSLISKCICSALFILIGVFAMIASDNYKLFAPLMLAGLFLSSWGDYFLGVTMKGKLFVAGIFSFMVAHIFYISAFVSFLAFTEPGRPLINISEIIFFIALLVVLAISSFAFKLDMGKLKALIFVYSAVIMAMLVKATSLAQVLYTAEGEHSVAAALLLFVGAVLFVVSDAVLSLMLFGGKDTQKMTILNLSTYFSAQVLLATSIYFVK